ncbi:MAG: DUF2330 domain-containing protein [Gammaproteobacteria bacterium]
MLSRQLVRAAALGAALIAAQAQAFCGFYVAKADTRLYNQASKVVLVRDGDRTVLTMANDYQGDPKEFAIVIPTPTVLQREQIHVGEPAVIDHLDAYSAPRLVEYFDPDPCARFEMMERMAPAAGAVMSKAARDDARQRSLGVTIEASYTVGEYDILILSATQSGGLVSWLRENGYRLPAGAEPVIGSYLKQSMKFFVAKVNLAERKKLGRSYLRPLQIAFESPKFMLPLRLGTLNANGAQELYVFTLTRKGRVEATNYRTVPLPSDIEIPVDVKERFGEFYKAMFDRATVREGRRGVFTEYAWDMGWCDPCAADPLTPAELGELGVFWLDAARDAGPAQNVFLTRLHVRYDAAHFPEDLVFQETGDRSNFQARYVLRHAWEGQARCPEAERYQREVLPRRHEQQARNLAELTGWNLDDILRRMPGGVPAAGADKWWERLWKQ